MFKKINITVFGNGRIETSPTLGRMDASEVEEDKALERRSLRQMAMGLGRIDTVEETMTGLVVIYTSGTVSITQWIVEAD